MPTPIPASAGSSDVAQPWFRHPIVWFTLALPALAVAGSTLSAVLAMRHADPVVVDLRPAHALGAEDAAEGTHPHPALEPAETARNHVTTPRR